MDYQPAAEEEYFFALKNYLKRNEGKSERDFLEERIMEFNQFIQEHEGKSKSELKRNIPQKNVVFRGREYPYRGPDISYERKLSDFKRLKTEYQIRLERLPEPQETPQFSVKLSAKEKIILLHETGVLDFLKAKKSLESSTNLLAKVVELITDIPQTTAQSYLNPMNSSSTEQRNNPLQNKKKVEKIKKILAHLGL